MKPLQNVGKSFSHTDPTSSPQESSARAACIQTWSGHSLSCSPVLPHLQHGSFLNIFNNLTHRIFCYKEGTNTCPLFLIQCSQHLALWLFPRATITFSLCIAASPCEPLEDSYINNLCSVVYSSYHLNLPVHQQMSLTQSSQFLTHNHLAAFNMRLFLVRRPWIVFLFRFPAAFEAVRLSEPLSP